MYRSPLLNSKTKITGDITLFLLSSYFVSKKFRFKFHNYVFGRGSKVGQTIGTIASDIFSFPPSMEK